MNLLINEYAVIFYDFAIFDFIEITHISIIINIQFKSNEHE